MHKVIVIYQPMPHIYIGIVNDEYLEQLQTCHCRYLNEHQIDWKIKATIDSIPYLLKYTPTSNLSYLEGYLIITGNLK